jgi:hypothetical protein
VKRTAHLHFVPRLRMSGARMPSWRAEGKFYIGTINVIHSEIQTYSFLFKMSEGKNRKLCASEYPNSPAYLLAFIYMQ